ncbi:secreted RxLR effector protein 161-like [Humulus lupulus]|uniref:secreted RxLR effector protein 161-like n=1 Tax=Humulus lupulus TaxID=3486 RepID=UPI002B417D87|nr:secreted RxLR effector protein 161-like [Humulus lupulus]
MESVPYAKAIGGVMYTMISTRLDITFAVSVLTRFMSKPGEEHYKGLKWLLRYLKATPSHGLRFSKEGTKIQLEGYVDSDYASNRDTRKSITSYCFHLNGCCISWKAQLKLVVTLFTTEVEFMAITEAFKEAVWIKGILSEVQMITGKVTVFSDSQSTIHLCKNHVFHERLLWIINKIEEGEVEVEKVPSEENLTDVGTKVLSISKFQHCLELLNIGSN